VKTVRYTLSAAKTLKRYGNMADRVRQAMRERAEDPTAHANNVKALKGSTGLRLRIGDFRVIYDETETEIVVTDFGPRGGIYDD
jgi:mRNA interferase RelE/StbE